MRKEFDWMPVILVAFALFAAFCIFAAIKSSGDYAKACESRGGHTRYVDTSGYAWVNGKYTYVSSGFTQCLTNDGRIVEV